MTIDALQEVINESGKLAQSLMNTRPELTVLPGINEAAQWMQVKMLAEIARQLVLLNTFGVPRNPNA